MQQGWRTRRCRWCPGTMTVVASTPAPGPALVYRGRPAGPNPNGRAATGHWRRARARVRDGDHRCPAAHHDDHDHNYDNRAGHHDDHGAADHDVNDHDHSPPTTTTTTIPTVDHDPTGNCGGRSTARSVPETSLPVDVPLARGAPTGDGHGPSAHRQGQRIDLLPGHGPPGRRHRHRRCCQPPTSPEGHLHSVR